MAKRCIVSLLSDRVDLATDAYMYENKHDDSNPLILLVRMRLRM